MAMGDALYMGGNNLMTQPIEPKEPDSIAELDEIIETALQDGWSIIDWHRRRRKDPTENLIKIKQEAKASIHSLITNQKIRELVTTCLAGMGGLTINQQEFIEARIKELEDTLK